MKGDGFTRREVGILVGAVAVLFAGGTLGFMSVLHESWHEALYRTIVTASLTGLDTTPRGLGAELLTILIVLSGVAIFGYFAAQIFDAIAHSVLGGAWREKKRRKMIEQLRDHIIVCGYGRVGRRAGDELREAGFPYVVLDFSEDALEHAREHDDLFVDGSGAEDEDLVKAGIDRARGIIVASDDDGDNLYITLSVKARRPEVTVIARASSEEAGRKLKLAGADRVVTPYTTAGRVMAQLMIRPQVTSFVHAMTSSDAPDLNWEEIEVTSECGAAGRTIGDLGISSRTGAHIVAVRRQGGVLEMRPTKDTVLEESDVIVGIGSPEEIGRLEALFGAQAGVVEGDND
ncbi:MAG: potassium channel protein [Thermoleophilia bacterium]|nr:potassium channel protein [Thermoleophilia bacterium]